jgi:hypothetical protein
MNDDPTHPMIDLTHPIVTVIHDPAAIAKARAKLAGDLAPLKIKFDLWWDVTMGPIENPKP